jgi:hypothetical protein
MQIIQFIQSRIYTIREEKIMLSRDIGLLYNIETEVFNHTIKINIKRFPKSCVFRLTKKEKEGLSFTIGTMQINRSSLEDQARAAVYAFTGQGIAVLSGIFDNARAVKVNIAIMQALKENKR